MLSVKYSIHIGMRVLSVKPLQFYCCCFPVSIILPMRKLLFRKKMLYSENVVLCMMAKYCKDRIVALAAKYPFVAYEYFVYQKSSKSVDLC